MNDDITVSALVVLRPHRPAAARGARRRAHHHERDRETILTVGGFFARKGFTIDDIAGTSLWIMSRPHRFKDLFGQALDIQRHDDRVQSVRLEDGSTEFSLTRLPIEISRHVLAVTFTEPLIDVCGGNDE